MQKREAYSEEALDKNPFTASLVIPVTRSTTYREYHANEGVLLPKTFVVERLGSCRLYYAPGSKSVIYNLSAGAQRLLLYIMLNLETGKDHFQLNRSHYMKSNDVGAINTLKAALAELVRYELIAPTQYESVYYLNPHYFYPGNRLTRYPDNIKIIQTR